MESNSGQDKEQNNKPLDTALKCLVMIAGYHGIAVQEEQLARAYVVTSSGMDTMTLLRAAKDIGLRARRVVETPERMGLLPQPCIVSLENGNKVMVLRYEKGRVLLADPYQSHQFLLTEAKFAEIWSGEAILFTERYEEKTENKKFDLYWFIPIILKYKKFIWQVMGMSLLLQLFGLISPLFTQVIIDKVLVHRSLSTLDVMVIGMVLVSLFQVWISSLRGYLFTHTTNKVDVMLSMKLFRHITSLPISYFSTWKVGDVVTRVRELDTVRQFITGSALTIVLDSIFTIVYIAAMFMYSGVLSVITLLILPIYILLNLFIVPVYRRRINNNFDANSANQAFLIESVTGIQAVKSLAVENNLRRKWEKMLSRYIKTSFATTNLANFAGNIGSLIQQLFVVIILWYGSYLVMENRITIGGLIAFQMMSGQVIAPVLRIVSMWQSFQQTKVSIDKLGDILNSDTEPVFNPTRTTLPQLQGDICFDRVTFRYRQDMAEVLYQLSLRIKAGQSVGIVGRSGSGKSTVTKLIQRLYVPEAGRVMVDGIDMAQIEPAWLRRQIGVVLQENFLFNGTVAENIAIAAPDASQEDIVHAAELSGASLFIDDLPKKYDTMVGERGSALSGGQRQRIAIARALITNPKIMIFDEATSALDYESEKIIMRNLDSISSGRTMIMIAHRLTTVCHCDRILVMDHGRLHESGTHEELLAAEGIYYSLWQQQSGIVPAKLQSLSEEVVPQ